MNKEFEQISKIQLLLSQALGVALNSLPANRSVVEAKSHIKQAMGKLEHAQKLQLKRKQTNEADFQKYWGTVQSPMSNTATQKSLAELNAMIDNEKTKLAELEKKSQTQLPNEMFND